MSVHFDEEPFPRLGGVRIGARPLGYRVLGEEGPTVVLVHGIARCASTWAQVALPLSSDHRVILPDLPGMGLSRAVPVPSTIEEHAALLGVTLEEEIARGPLHVFGLSMGGMVSLALSALLGPRCASLVVASSSGRDTGLMRLGSGALLRILGRLLRLRRSDHRLNIQELVGPSTLQRWPDLAERLDAAQREEGMSRGATMRQLLACARFAVRPYRGRLPAVATAVVGTRDRFVPARNSRRLARILDLPLVELEGVGHDLSLDAPQEVVRLLREITGRVAS